MNAAVKIEPKAAVVQFNLDLSILRCDAPIEFRPIGSVMSLWRKHRAETGTIHKTACHLGLLFQDLLPETPLLRVAYGKRASEIASDPKANPAKAQDYGPFQEYAGIDCSSIWAAATTRVTSALQLHLLACVLARSWDSKMATSIWVELVSKRKDQILSAMERGVVNPNSVAAAHEEIGRQKLAEWDASCRAWLRRADESKTWAQHQLRVIFSNLSLPFDSTGTTYENVTNAWIKSMKAVEDLLKGHSLEAYDRALLVAIYSWHLYPDLLVFQTEAKNVSLMDDLFPKAAILSLGIEQKITSKLDFERVTRWSLALSHFKVYGPPVVVHSSGSLSRITFDELWLVTLGAMFQKWLIKLSQVDSAVEWFCALSPVLKSSSAHANRLSWLCKLCDAAVSLSESHGEKRDRLLDLLKYGHRREPKYLGPTSWPTAFFGLCNVSVMRGLSQSHPIDCGFECIRSDFQLAGTKPTQACIQLGSFLFFDEGVEHHYNEFATIAPVLVNASTNEYRYVRWIWIERISGRRLDMLSKGWTELDHRRAQIQSLGEVCYILGDRSDNKEKDLYFSLNTIANPFEDKSGRLFRSYDSIYKQTSGTRVRGFVIWQDPTLAVRGVENLRGQNVQDGTKWLLSHNEARKEKILQHIRVTCSGTAEFLRTTATTTKKRKSLWEDVPTQLQLDNLRTINEAGGSPYMVMATCSFQPVEMRVSLEILDLASRLYFRMPAAMVSSRIIGMDLSKSNWLPERFKEQIKGGGPSGSLTNVDEAWEEMKRPNSFGCIAMFESGKFNIDLENLEEVIALCAVDSLFVAGILLADPADITPGYDIQHIVGNIGHTGMVLMMAPESQQVRSPGDEVKRLAHAQYNGQRQNSFGGTSLHLSFTEAKFALDHWSSIEDIDREVFLLLSIITVRDKGEQVGEIDVLELERNAFDVATIECDCQSQTILPSSMEMEEEHDFISIDSWDEFLDPPTRAVSIFRSKGNWVARLACASILIQRGHSNVLSVIKDGDMCWKCFIDAYCYPERHVPSFIID